MKSRERVRERQGEREREREREREKGREREREGGRERQRKIQRNERLLEHPHKYVLVLKRITFCYVYAWRPCYFSVCEALKRRLLELLFALF